MDGQKKGGSAWLWAVVVVVIALGAYGAYKYSNSNEAVTNPAMSDGTSAPLESTNPNAANDGSTAGVDVGVTVGSSAYKDGTYTAVGHYNSPEGAEQITVTLTLKSDVVTAASVTNSQTFRSESKEYQGKFISGYQALVVGKKITDIKLTRVSGSSLTPIGWNDAVAKIQTQAKA